MLTSTFRLSELDILLSGVFILSECIKSANIKDVFVLCTKGELIKYRVPSLLEDYTRAGLVVHHHPFQDGSTPTMDSLVEMLEQMKVNLMNGIESLVQ